MKNNKLTLKQETVRRLSDQNGLLACSVIATKVVSVCNICIPPTESPDCNPSI